MTYRDLFGAFFPHAFLLLPVILPAPTWDDDPADAWLPGEPTETMTDLDATSAESFDPIPGLD